MSILNDTKVKTIKQRIWDGELHETIADDMNCSASLIGNIASGHKWERIPWPDGSTGALLPQRQEKILQARREAKKTLNQHVKKILKANG